MKKIILRLRTFLRPRTSRAAFTLIEMLVVIGISTLVSAAAIVYSTIGQNEVALTVETAKIAQLMLEARGLALDTYTGTSGACAYGVHLDFTSQTYSLFAYTPGTAHCPPLADVTAGGLASPSAISEYAPSSWQLPVTQGVVLASPGSVSCTNPMTDILFYPPAPTVLIALASGRNGSFASPSPAESSVCLQTSDGKNTATITVNPEGQINF